MTILAARVKRSNAWRGRGYVPPDVKAIAYRRIDTLFDLAERAGSTGNQAMADRYVKIARNVAKKATIPIPQRYKPFYCRKCSSFLLPGKTSRIRIKRGKVIRTCLVCGSISRVNLSFQRKQKPQ